MTDTIDPSLRYTNVWDTLEEYTKHPETYQGNYEFAKRMGFEDDDDFFNWLFDLPSDESDPLRGMVKRLNEDALITNLRDDIESAGWLTDINQTCCNTCLFYEHRNDTAPLIGLNEQYCEITGARQHLYLAVIAADVEKAVLMLSLKGWPVSVERGLAVIDLDEVPIEKWKRVAR